ncbi:MAG: hypothetical protein RR784_09605 [Burkholderiaceae bacterium]
MPGLKRMRSAGLPLLAMALGASVILHRLVLEAGGSPLRPETPAWGRLEVSLMAPGRAEGRSGLGLSSSVREARPRAAALAGPAPATSASSAARFGTDEAATTPALPLEGRGDSLVLPTAVRAIYRAPGGGQRQLVWRLTGERYSLRWSAGLGAAEIVESAQGVVSWMGLLSLHYSRRQGSSLERLDFDWSRQRLSGDVDAPIEAATVDAASLLMQLAVSHQWLDAARRSAGWELPVAGQGRVRVSEMAGGVGAPRYRIEWVARAGAWAARVVEFELAPEHGFLPAAFRAVDQDGETEWRLVSVENLPVE